MNITVPLRYLSPIKPPPPPPDESKTQTKKDDQQPPPPPEPQVGDYVCLPETGSVGEIIKVYPDGDIEVRELSRDEIKIAKQSLGLPESKRFYDLLNKLIKETKI
jgi:hypothetical protein